MIFGSTDDFAIEAMVEPGLKPPSAVWGRMRVWVQGVSIGDFDREHCTLGAAESRFRRLLEELDSLWLEEFSTLSGLELMNKLDTALYGFPVEDETIDPAPFRKFNFLTNWCESFDRGGKSFIFCKPDGSAFVLNRELFPDGKKLVTTRDSLRRAIVPFVAWAKAEADRLAG
jgi:hypothetical protein